MTKILLITPPLQDRSNLSLNLPTLAGTVEPAPPLAITALANFLKREMPKLKIFVLDGYISDLKFIFGKIKEFRPHVVGISCTFMNYDNALACAKLSKSLGAKVILGGHYASAAAQNILKNRGPGSKDYCIDAVCRQDGEEALLRFVEGVAYHKIPNLVWRQGNRIRLNEIKNIDLSQLPPLSFDGIGFSDIDIRNYYRAQVLKRKCRPRFLKEKLFSADLKTIYVYSRRGCSWKNLSKGGCIFCSIAYSNVRSKTPQSFLEEIFFLKKRYEANLFFDVSDDFLGDPQWFKEFYRLAFGRKDLPKFLIYSRLNGIDKKTARMLNNLKVVAILVGLESGSDQILTLMRKGLRREDCLRSIKFLSEYDIGLIASFIFGGPGETTQTLASTLRLMNLLKRTYPKISFRFSRFTVIVGSLAFELLTKKTGKKYLDADCLNQEEAFRDWLKYFTKITPDDILKARKKAEKIILS